MGELKGPTKEEQIMLHVLAAVEGLISVICDSGQDEGLTVRTPDRCDVCEGQTLPRYGY